MNAMPLVHRICSITDPFCEGAKGARRSDSSTTPTLGIQLKQRITYSFDVANYCIYYVPGFPYGAGVATVSGDTITTMASLLKIDPSGTWDNVVSEYRFVSAGIRLQYSGPPLYAGGTVTFMTASQLQPSTAYNTASPQNWVRYETFPVGSLINKPVHFIHMPDSQTSMAMYRNKSAIDEAASALDCLVIRFDGMVPNQASFVVEVIYNLEVRLTPNQGVASLAKPPPPFSPAVEDVSRATTSALPQFLHSSQKAAESAVQNVVYRAVTALGETAVVYGARALGTYLGGPAGGAIAGGATSLLIHDVD